MGRGALIVMEGCDRSGKSTQSKLLVDQLNKDNIPAKLVCFPDRTTDTGKLIDDYLKKNVELPDQVIHLLFTANRWELAPQIRKDLFQGITVIADRYSFSGVAYSWAKKTMPIDWLKAPEAGLPKPDLVLFLTMAEQSVKERKGFGEERYELADFQQHVLECYNELKNDTWRIIDANKSIEELNEILVNIVKEVVEHSKKQELKVLW